MKKIICVLLFLMVLCTAAAAVPEESQEVSAGNIITFGNYEQDNNPDNGPEPIEWIVLDVQDGKALLLSKYGLDAKPYDEEPRKITWEPCVITWEACTLRAFLNSEFLNEAFSGEEQSAILLTEVDNSNAQAFDWSTIGGSEISDGNNTQDRVFLLSYAEANRYLGVQYCGEDGAGQNLKSRAAPTAYAIARGAWVNNDCLTADGEAAGWFWFLRSPGDGQGYVGIVNSDGSFNYVDAYYEYGCFRPALWLDLEPDL